MAAVTPHLERQDDPAETAAEDTYFARVRIDRKGLSGLGKAEGDVLIRGSLSSDVLNDSHAGLERVAYTRMALLESLRDVPYEVLQRKRHGSLELYIRTHTPSGLDPRWNAPGAGSLHNTSLLSWTSKMGAPSFSLPAGSPIMMGTCPGADAGQSVVPRDKLISASRLVTRVTGHPVVLPDAICQHCYAEGGNYAYGNIQWHQLMRMIWARQAVRDGSFVELMTHAVDNANYLLDGGNVPGKAAAGAYDPERHEGRFFRIQRQRRLLRQALPRRVATGRAQPTRHHLLGAHAHLGHLVGRARRQRAQCRPDQPHPSPEHLPRERTAA